MSDAEEVKFSLKVMINKEKTKVLFAEADSHFIDILLSFLTLPLGRIMKVLEKHYGDEAPTVGSLNSLYHSLANLDSAHFWTEGAKLTLLNPTSSFEDEYERLKLDICEFQPAEYFFCRFCARNRFRSASMHYDQVVYCQSCRTYCALSKEVGKSGSEAAASDGVFTKRTPSFIISDDLQILPSVTGLLRIISILGITETDKAEPIKVTLGLSEIMDLVKASLISPTPLSDLLLNKTRETNSLVVDSEPNTSSDQIENEVPNSTKMILKVMIQKSTNKLLYAQAEEDFVELLFSFLTIPIGGVERLLSGKTCIKTINNLYRSTTDLIDDKYFKTPDLKKRLTKLNLPHGYISQNHILPLTEECLPVAYRDLSFFNSINFPKGQGCYLEGPQTYQVTDDLSVTPFCIISILSTLNELKIPISDVEELELQIGLKEIFASDIGLLRDTSILDAKGTDDAELMNVTFGLSEIMNLLKASMISHAPLFSSLYFPQGHGNYVKGPRTSYQVFDDDLTFKPFYTSSVICSLNQLKIPVSDVRELEILIGLEEALSTLKAPLTSKAALTNVLRNHISNKRPKPTYALLNHLSN